MPSGKKGPGIQKFLTGKGASYLQDKMTWLMNNAEIHNRRVSTIMGNSVADDALKTLRGETPSLHKNMNDAEARRLEKRSELMEAQELSVGKQARLLR